MTKGQFRSIYVPFSTPTGGNISAKDQAIQILTEADRIIKDSFPGVAITYSANYSQTLKIKETYDSGGWNTGTRGDNQGMVMEEMEKLLSTGTYSHLQGKMRIAPITTTSNQTSSFGSFTHDQVIANDIANINGLLGAGFVVLGWVNQQTKPALAVSGGVAGGLTPAQYKACVEGVDGMISDYAAF